MKIFWRSELNGRAGIAAEPEGYDGVPWIRELWMDRAPVALHPDRVAVAAALVFGRDAVGDLEFELPVSIGVAESIKAFCRAPSLNVTPVDYEQRPFADGSGRMEVVTNSFSGSGQPHFLDDRTLTLSVMRSDQYAGSLISSNGLLVSSNAYLHDAQTHRREGTAYGSLAVGVLFAEDLGLDSCSTSGVSLPFDASEMLIASGLRTL